MEAAIIDEGAEGLICAHHLVSHIFVIRHKLIVNSSQSKMPIMEEKEKC
jgi:hypothetical protein